MEISTGSWHISIVDEARSSFNSRKIRSYPVVVNLDDPAPPYSVYGIFCNTAPVVLLAACAGGPTVVHAHSAFVLDGRLYVTIANRIVCLSLRPFTLHWVLNLLWRLFSQSDARSARSRRTPHQPFYRGGSAAMAIARPRYLHRAAEPGERVRPGA